MMVSVHMVNRNPKMDVLQMEDSDDGKCSTCIQLVYSSFFSCRP